MKGNDCATTAENRSGLGQTAYKRSLAYRRLGVDPKDVELAPFFRAQLRRIARCMARGRETSDSSGGNSCPLDFLQSSDDPDARRVLGTYLSVPESYRRLLPPEAFCHAAGVSPWRTLECITVVAVRQTAHAAAIVASLLHPCVVEKTVKRALQDDGSKDRLMLHKAVGFVPTCGWKGDS